MLHRYGNVLNLPVICADSGKRAGTVKDLIFDSGKKEVMALLLESAGLFLKKKAVLLEELLDFRGDAAVISSKSCIKEIDIQDYFEVFPGIGCLIGIKVFSKSAGEIGTVSDVIFDAESGRIEGFEISDGLLQDIMQGRKMLPLVGKVEFGKDFAVVENEAVEEMQDTGGGIRNKFLK
mgnify:CR=1 FL=1